LDGEIDSDDALGESEDEKFKEFVFRGSGKPKDAAGGGHSKRKTAADFMSGSDDEALDEVADESDDVEDGGAQIDGTDESGSESQEELLEVGDQDEDEDIDEDEDDEDEDEDEDEEEDEEDEDDDSNSEEDSDEDDRGDDEQSRRAELRKMMSEEQKTVVATISQAAKDDAEKGNAVKAQRKTFDSLLNVRIRLQKALVATNSMASLEQMSEDSTPYKAAEEAAVKLLNTLNAMRSELDKTATNSKKRKHTTIDTTTASCDIWAAIQASESQSVPKRQATLAKWSARVRGTTATPISRKLNTATEQSIVDVLSEQLSGANAERLVKRTKMPRSCAPIQVKAKITEDPNIYDDADFYQLLLKELVDQRMVDSSSAPSMETGGQPVAQWAAAKEAKTKKNVDTRASKGRKMKFTVHEKLQNFMAPEDRGLWESEAIDRFFGTLLGQKMNLGEDDESDEEEKVPLAEEALMLFRS
jgi:protein AATF/BFR2